MPESWGVFVLIAVVLAMAAAVGWMYLREMDSCPRPVKLLLAVLRFSVLLLLVILFLKPSISFKQVSTLKPTIGMVRDASLSFAQADEYRSNEALRQAANATGWDPDDLKQGAYSRAQVLERALARNDRAAIRALRDKGSIRVIDFAEAPSDVALLSPRSADEGRDRVPDASADDRDRGDGPTPAPDATRQTDRLPPLLADGSRTDLSRALRELLNDSNRLSAVIIASDGQDNGPDNPVELARRFAEKNIPVFTLGVGDPARPRNLAVTDVYVREKAQAREQFKVEARFYAEDIPDSEVDVQLIQRNLDGSGQVIDETLVATEPLQISAGGKLQLDFDHVVPTPGKFSYKVAIAPRDDEIDAADNERVSSVLEVVDEKIKVLLIAGAPTWDYSLVYPLLQRDENITLSCWLQSMDPARSQEGNQPIAKFPTTVEELGQYNVIMLIDPDPTRDFTEQWVASIRTFCQRNAGGLLYMAGPKFTNMFMSLNRFEGFKTILPVRFGDDSFYASAEADLQTASLRNTTGKMLVVQHNLDHPVMSFSKDQRANSQLWQKMPSIQWSYPTLSAKPGARVLLERGDNMTNQGNQPLLVAGRFGAGNVLYMGFSGTWRWRRLGVQAQYFDRFWIQVVRFLVENRSLQGSRRGYIDSDKSEYELGDTVTLIAEINDERFRPLTQPAVAALLRGTDGTTADVELKKLPGEDGLYEGAFVAQRIGTFQVYVNLPGTDQRTEIEEISFRVEPPSVESQAYWLNEKLLREIAEASGGQYFSIDQWDQLVAAVPATETPTDYNTPPEPIWDVHRPLRWIVFLIPFLLLTVEWAVRKRYRLL